MAGSTESKGKTEIKGEKSQTFWMEIGTCWKRVDGLLSLMTRMSNDGERLRLYLDKAG